ncbi:uncharacterized protein BYT42DRAFT_546854 [Radiomyces spectabilis]|uniref:uncharacterized protein n=1 Tax=Radiomyces spectabilis TaxID=64574 RepID=UPI00221F7470|nr:uncharacterized protein BYT42DRAFT_546854 [Radiomyces spectabilis]KAI8376138.1 hypothetical protein BYT42DRAFT_546854 [Radiomyces spectabilis]
MFTLAIGAFFKVETLTMVKMMAVGISFLGIILVSYSDQLSDKQPLPHPSSADPSASSWSIPTRIIGDIFALLGALFYGCYTTLLKLKIGDETRVDMPLFFGYVGAFNVVLLWPFLFVLHWTGLEPLELPSTETLWAMILINAFIGTFLSDYIWLLAMLMTSPLVVTLGISLTIPLALVGDVVFKHVIPGSQYALGAVLVVIGFFIVNITTLASVKTQPHLVSQDENSQTESSSSP